MHLLSIKIIRRLSLQEEMVKTLFSVLVFYDVLQLHKVMCVNVCGHILYRLVFNLYWIALNE